MKNISLNDDCPASSRESEAAQGLRGSGHSLATPLSLCFFAVQLILSGLVRTVSGAR
jgi:hypothetical protein